jgi:hypothetical protein
MVEAQGGAREMGEELKKHGFLYHLWHHLQ